MKTLISFVFLIVSFNSVIAQNNTYPVLLAAYKCVNEYNYNSSADTNEKKCITVKRNKQLKKRLKIISNALSTFGFTFNNMNDTILLEFIYDDHIVGGVPSEIYARSSKSKRILKIVSYKELTYKESSVAEKEKFQDYLNAMYLGNVNYIKTLFGQNKTNTLGSYVTALRIAIKNDKIVYPTIMWNYEYVLR